MKFFDTYLHADDLTYMYQYMHVHACIDTCRSNHQHASTINSSHWHFVESLNIPVSIHEISF